MKVGFYGKAFGSDYDELMRDVIRLLKESSVDIMIYEPFWNDIKHCVSDIEFELFNTSEEIKNQIDMLFSFGGDGTILDSVPLIRDSGIPVLGINTGTLGFLASVSPQSSTEAVKNIIKRLELFGDDKVALHLMDKELGERV